MRLFYPISVNKNILKLYMRKGNDKELDAISNEIKNNVIQKAYKKHGAY